MHHIPREIIELEKLDHGIPVRCRIEVFLDSAHIVADDAEVIFDSPPDFREQAISHLEKLGYACLAPGPAGWACVAGQKVAAAAPIDVDHSPLKCLSPDCGDWVGFDFGGVEFHYRAEQRPGAAQAEKAATHRVAKWTCRNCGCQIQSFHPVE